jgi:cytochrome c-type biogenesis protein CcmH/NrfG
MYSYLTSYLQAIQEDPDDAVHWHQLGLYNICTTQFSGSVNFLKAAIARSPDCSYAWSNLGKFRAILSKQAIIILIIFCVCHGL